MQVQSAEDVGVAEEEEEAPEDEEELADEEHDLHARVHPHHHVRHYGDGEVKHHDGHQQAHLSTTQKKGRIIIIICGTSEQLLRT